VDGRVVHAKRQGGTWSVVGALTTPSGTTPLTVDAALSSSGAYYVAYSTRFPYVVRMARSASINTAITTDPSWTPLAITTASWPDIAIFADPQPRLVVCSAAGVRVYTNNGTSWGDTTVSSNECFRMRAWSDGGVLTISWLDADYKHNYAFRSGGMWETYAFPDPGTSESYIGVEAMPGPTTLFVGGALVGVPAVGAFEPPEYFTRAFSCNYPQPLVVANGLFVSCASTGYLIRLEP
jgi:hypothetical protein